MNDCTPDRPLPLSTEPHVLIWPDAQPVGWPPVDPTSSDDAPDLPCLPLRRALALSHDGDKPHVCAAVLVTPDTPDPYEKTHPRLNKGAEAVLKADHDENPDDPRTRVEARTLFIDFDLHDAQGDKRPWKTGEAATFLAAVHDEAQDEDHPLHGAYLYSTPHGWRAAFALSRSVPPHLYLGFARTFLRALQNEGLEPDPACHPTIGRGYALPRPDAARAYDPAVWGPDAPLHALQAISLDPTPFITRAARSGDHSASYTPLDPAVAGILASLPRPEPSPPSPSRLALPLRQALSRGFTIAGLGDQWRALLHGRPAFGARERNDLSFRFAALAVETLADHFHVEPDTYAPLDDSATLTALATSGYAALEPSITAACSAGISGTPIEQARAELWRMIIKQAAKEPGRERPERPTRAAPNADALARALATARNAPASTPDTPAPSFEAPLPSNASPPEGSRTPPSQPSAPEGSPLLVVHGSTYFVRDARSSSDDSREGDDAPLRFFGPTKNANAATVRLARGTSSLSEPAWVRGRADAQGRGAPRSWRNIEVDYGYVVDVVVTDHGSDAASLSPWPPQPGKRSTLVLPGLSIFPHEAHHDPEIEEWLDALAGDDVLGLRAWLGSAHLLGEPTAAVYLQGDPSVGKGLFINALRTLWADLQDAGPAVVRFGEVMGRFNAGLEQSPIVLLNEHIKHPGQPPKDEAVTARFRDFVGNFEHRVEAKNQSLREVRGCPRLVITANDERALPLGGVESEQALSAIIERLRHFDVDPEAAEVIKRAGGVRGVERWVEGRAFARHVAHLRNLWSEGEFDNVPGVKGHRYLVSGVRRPYHERLVLQGRRLDTLEAVALALTAGRKAAAMAGVRAEGGGVIVDPGALAERWTALTGNFKPRRADIARALASLQGSTEVRRNKKRMRLIPGTWVRKAARLTSVGTEETVMQALLAPTTEDDYAPALTAARNKQKTARKG